MTNSFTNILSWKKSHEFVIKVYKTTKIFPDYERFGLSSQFQRAAVSIPANIAEGYKKLSKADKLRFMNIAQASLEECRYYIILCKDLEYINNWNDIEEVSKLLNGYCKGILANNFKANEVTS